MCMVCLTPGNCNCNHIIFTKLPWPETAKGPFGLRVKLPPAYLSTTHGGGFTGCDSHLLSSKLNVVWA